MSEIKKISIIIRTLNEERYLGELLESIARQELSENYQIETIIVDSGSTDRTLEIAKTFDCYITHIAKADFSFGRSLNLGCDSASGDFFVFISGHCIPTDELWLKKLISPLENECVYTYGRQVGRDTTKFSEQQLFNKYFPDASQIPQEGFFINNANAAIRASIWKDNRFDESLTGVRTWISEKFWWVRVCVWVMLLRQMFFIYTMKHGLRQK